MSSPGSWCADPDYVLLLDRLRPAGSAVLAFSGGVDSSFLLAALQDSGIRFLAVTGISETMPETDRASAREIIALRKAPHLEIATEELRHEGFAQNPPDRCFFCKDELFSKLQEIRLREGLDCVMDGSNSDDLRDYRPGMRAAALHNVRSPLAEAGLTKQTIRRLSKALGLPTWDRPSSPCLSSRIPYGSPITIERLKRIEQAESLLRSLGIRELRVRDQGDTARIELNPADMRRMLENDLRERAVAGLKNLGYAYVSLDLEGYKSGSMNRVLDKSKAGA